MEYSSSDFFSNYLKIKTIVREDVPGGPVDLRLCASTIWGLGSFSSGGTKNLDAG